MNDEKFAVILVFSTNHALRAEHILETHHITCKLIPVPRHLSSECGSCLRIYQRDKEQVCHSLENAGVEIAGVHDI